MRLMFKFSVILLILFCYCGTNKSNETATATGNDLNSNKTENRDEQSNGHNVIEDTMILNDKIDLIKTPDSEDKNFITLEKCTVFVLDKNPIPNISLPNAVDTFVKVRTINNDTGYLWKKVLSTKSRFKTHNDSIAMWAKLPMPLYKNLIGTTYWKNSELPVELYSGAFITVGPKSDYGIISVCNQYNNTYEYLFFVQNQEPNDDGDNGLLIHDIIPLDWRTFDKEASLMFQQCECVDTTQECSDVVAVYAHNEELALQEILVTPIKAWRPDYMLQKLIDIPVETVRCGSMAPEEPGGY